MDIEKLIQDRVKTYYHSEDLNCATTTLKVLAEHFDIELSPQVVDAALGMHGAGRYGAQCGLVEGALMFVGIIGRQLNADDDDIVKSCNDFAGRFESRFGALACNVLRPGGFNDDDPPHLCDGFTREAIRFDVEFLNRFLDKFKMRGV